MRAGMYGRYSSDNQNRTSVQDQFSLCLAWCEKQGFVPAVCHGDEAVSGVSMIRRGIQGLQADARAGKFDVVVAEALDRISRDQEDIAGFFKQMQFLGIPIFTIAEGEISELHVGLKGTMNALFLKDLAKRLAAAYVASLRRGNRAAVLLTGMR